MKSNTAFVILSVLALSMVMGYESAYAATDLDALVNLATQARSQIKMQLDSTDATTEVKAMYARGDAETNLLISTARGGDAEEAKQHFLAAMNLFRQITQTFSEPDQEERTEMRADVTVLEAPDQAESEIVYRNNILRTERYIDTLRTAVVKNNLTVDFANAYELIREAKASLADGDLDRVDRILEELRAVRAQIHKEIRDQSIQQSNARVRAFVNEYLLQIDTILDQSDELGLTEDDIVKLTGIKDELRSTHDANQLITKIKEYSVTINIVDYRNQKIQSEVARLEQKIAVLQAEADDDVKPKIEDVRNLITRIKNQSASGGPMEMLALLDSAVREIEVHVKSKNATDRPVPERPAQNETRNTPERPAPSETRDTPEMPAQNETRNTPERPAQSQETRQAQNEIKPRFQAEISKFEERIMKLEPHVDGNLEKRLDDAKQILEMIKDRAKSNDPTFQRVVAMLDKLLDQIEDQVRWQNNTPDTETRSNPKPVVPSASR